MGRSADVETARRGAGGGLSGNGSGNRCPNGEGVSGWLDKPLGAQHRRWLIVADLAPVPVGISHLRRRLIRCTGCGLERAVTVLDTERTCGSCGSSARHKTAASLDTSAGLYAIFDRGPRLDEWVPYIPRAWSREDALGELAALLAPYPAGSPWRRRLVAARACGEDVAAAS